MAKLFISTVPPLGRGCGLSVCACRPFGRLFALLRGRISHVLLSSGYSLSG